MPSKYLMKSEDFRIVYVNLSKNLYRLIVKDKATGNEYIIADGLDKTLKFHLPTEVRIRKVGVVHTTSDLAVRSTDLMTFQFGIDPWGKDKRPSHNLIDETTNEDDPSWPLNWGYEEPAEAVEIVVNTTSTNRVSVYIDVQVIGAGK